MADNSFKAVLSLLNEYGEYWVDNSRNILIEGGKIASGGLINSMQSKVDYYFPQFIVSVNLEDYWYYVANGRKAGKFPPIDAIREWIRIKPIYPREITLSTGRVIIPTENQLAYLIGRSISINGISGNDFFNRSSEMTYLSFVNELGEALSSDISQDIEINFKQLSGYNYKFIEIR